LQSDLRRRLIFAGRTLVVYMDLCSRFVRWAGVELGVRRLVEAQLAGQLWVQGLIDAGRSAWTISAAISALRKLEWGIQARWGRKVTLVAPKALDKGTSPYITPNVSGKTIRNTPVRGRTSHGQLRAEVWTNNISMRRLKTLFLLTRYSLCSCRLPPVSSQTVLAPAE
jgi:hypothetical protein